MGNEGVKVSDSGFLDFFFLGLDIQGVFLATLVALHFTPVSKSVVVSD